MVQKQLEIKPKWVNRKEMKQKRHRRIVVAFLLPAIIFFWAIGWGLCWIGSRNQKPQKMSTKSTTHDGILHPIDFAGEKL